MSAPDPAAGPSNSTNIQNGLATPEATPKPLSGAELKKQKQAEKAAKRAADKQSRGLAPVTPPSMASSSAQSSTSRRPDTITPSTAPTSSAPQSNARRPDAIPIHVRRPPPGQASPGTPGTPSGRNRRGSTSRPQATRPLAAEKEVSKRDAKDTKQVALFNHLYGQPRRTTIAGAGKDVHPAVLTLGLQMSNYVICGSNARCVATLLAFRKVIQSYTTPEKTSLPRHLTSHLNPQIEFLVSCRPLSTSMGNAIRWLKLQINAVDPATPEDRAKTDLCEAIDGFIKERIIIADQVISASAAAKIQNGDVILTFAKSSIVEQTLLQAHSQGKQFEVIVVDSRPLFEGRNLADSLSRAGIEVRYTNALLQSISSLVRDSTKVFLGAHSMLSNGRLYSRAGTAIVAMEAKEADRPVIVCCESLKFSDRVALDSIVTNEVAPPDELLIQGKGATELTGWRDKPNLFVLNLMYDVTPAEYITLIVSEYGLLPPSSIPVVHRLSTNT